MSILCDRIIGAEWKGPLNKILVPGPCSPLDGVYIYGHLGDGRQSNWATANWATHFGQLGDNIGRVIKDVNVGKIFEIISF